MAKKKQISVAEVEKLIDELDVPIASTIKSAGDVLDMVFLRYKPATGLFHVYSPCGTNIETANIVEAVTLYNSLI